MVAVVKGSEVAGNIVLIGLEFSFAVGKGKLDSSGSDAPSDDPVSMCRNCF
jgi:hypothetical protein